MKSFVPLCRINPIKNFFCFLNFLRQLALVIVATFFSLPGFPSTKPTQSSHRIVSLAPNLTELVFALDAQNELVGVTSQCDFPQEAKKIAKIGDYHAPNLEPLILARPDIVLATEGNPRETLDKLRKVGMKIHEFKPNNVAELPGEVRKLGQLLNRKDKAHALAVDLEKALGDLEKMPRGSRSYLFVLQLEPMYVVGNGTWLGSLFSAAGYTNSARNAVGTYPVLSREFLMRHPPDVVFFSEDILGSLPEKERSTLALGRVSDEVQRRVTHFIGKQAQSPSFVMLPRDVFMRPGPRLTEAMRFLQKLKL